MRNQISNGDNILDSRDVEKRIEELEEEKEEFILNESETEDESPSWGEVADAQADAESKWEETDEGEELKTLKAFWDDLEGYVSGGETLIRDSYFEQYAREFCDEVYDMQEIPDLIKNNIDWSEVANDMQVDYSSAEWDGVTYWFAAH